MSIIEQQLDAKDRCERCLVEDKSEDNKLCVKCSKDYYLDE